MPKPIKNILFSQLAQGDPSQPFDGMSAGDFVDMYGRPVVIKPEDLAVYVANTQRNILATADASGNVIGLPIDCMNHDHGQAAGWITDVQLDSERNVILFTPRWNEVGRSLIDGDTMRFFSAEFYTTQKVIIGGSLTNWPATRNRQNQQVMLRPIALSQSLSSISVDESMDERLHNIRSRFQEFAGSWYVYAVEVFSDYLICFDEDEGKLYKVSFSEGADGLAFEDRTAWVEVKQTYIEAAMQAAKDFFSRVFSGFSKRDAVEPSADEPGSILSTPQPEDDMTDVSKLTPEQRSALLAQLTSGSDLPAELATLIDTRANERVSALLAVEQRKRDTVALASRLVGGTAEAPNGLPVDKDQLAAFLLSLSPEQAEQATAILEKVQSAGLVSFAEVGHGRELEGKTPLPQYFAEALDSGKIQLADLSNPILGLGDPSQYDLSKWSKEQ